MCKFLSKIILLSVVCMSVFSCTSAENPTIVALSENNPLNLPTEALNAPKCTKEYTIKGATNEEKYFNKMDCVPQLDQINYWESEDYLKKFDSVPVKIAVIDGYFNTNHPDLKNAVSKTYSLVKASCYPVDFSKSECLSVLPPDVSVTSENITGLNHGSIISGVIAGQ